MSETPELIYLDVCALCRPFDDQTQMRIRLETEAVQLILSYVYSRQFRLIVSPVHYTEIEAIDDLVERQHLLSTLQQVGCMTAVDLWQTRERAEELIRQGLGPADSAHIAFAEATGARFITCDDRLLRQCGRIRPRIEASAPAAFCAEENL